MPSASWPHTPVTAGRMATVALGSRLLRCLMIVLLAASVLLSRGSSNVSAQVNGSTYSSPKYGFTLTWDDTWFVLQDQSADEMLMISNGASTAIFLADDDTSPNAEVLINSLGAALGLSFGFEDMVPLRDAAGNIVRGSDETKAFAAFSFTMSLPDGSRVPMATYMEARPIVQGQSYLLLLTMTAVNSFWFQMPAYQALTAGIMIPSAESVPQQVIGEPGPAFVEGPWRIAIAAATQGRDVPGLGLAEKSGKEWIVVVLDVTNWSARAVELNPRDFRVQATGGADPVKLAPASTATLTKRYGTAEFTEDMRLSLESDASARIVLAYSAAPGGKSYSLVSAETAIPLSSRFSVDLTEASLPAVALAAEPADAEIVSASDGKTMRIQVRGEVKSQRIQLLGVEPPAEGECFANQAEITLDDLAGTQVLVEEDAAITGGRIPQRYVWLVNIDGTRTLLNQMLIAEGMADAGEVPGDARFGLWLELESGAAEKAEVGMWGDCSTPTDASPIPGGKSTPAAP